MLEPGRRTEGDFLDLPSFHDDEEFEDELLQPSRPWWRSPKGIAAVAGVLIIALLVGSFAVIHSRPTPITYQYVTIATGGLVTTVSATGPVQGALYDVNFSGSGTISQIDVKVGQQVKSGQVLAKLDASSLQAALTQAQIQANNAYFAEQNAYISEQQAINNCNTEKTPRSTACSRRRTSTRRRRTSTRWRCNRYRRHRITLPTIL
jgi:multidrug efflux pump subunit AcrA (membrane-fusion protein)